MLLYFLAIVLICIAIEYCADPVIPRAKGTRKRRWPTNIALYVINTGLSAALPLSFLAVAHYADENGIGLLNWLNPPYGIDAMATVLIGSLSIYIFHRLHHSVPILWRFHRVHHSDNDLDWSSTLRHHPGETFFMILLQSATVFAFGLDATALFALLILHIGIDFFTHSRFMLPPRIERSLQWVMITPQLHHIHHSSWQPETDSNYGIDFSIWDRLFGTLNRQPLRSMDSFAYGIDTVDPAVSNDLDWLLTSPLVPDSTDWAETPEHARTYRP